MTAGAGSFLGASEAAANFGSVIGSNPTGASNTSVAGFQQPFLEDLFQRGSDFSQQSGFVGFDPLQQQGQNSALNAANNIGSFASDAQSANQFLLGDVLNPSSNPYLQASADAAIAPIFENLNQNVLPGIRGGAAQVGGVGSSRQGIAEGLASSGALGAAGDVSTNIFSRAYGQGLNALTQGLQLAPQTAQLGLLPSQIQRGIGQERRGLSQEKLLDPFTQLQRFQQILGSPILESQTDPGGGSGISGLFADNGLLGGIF